MRELCRRPGASENKVFTYPWDKEEKEKKRERESDL